MSEGFLLSRVLLRFSKQSKHLIEDLSAAAITPDGSLWLGCDEGQAVERLSPLEACVYGDHRAFAVGDFVDLLDDKDEIDIEGMDYSDHYLWLVGSHSSKRKKPKGKKTEKDLKRLATVSTDANRYLLVRIPVMNGELFQSFAHPDTEQEELRAAALVAQPDGNVLTEALKDDPHLGPFLSIALPSKENGFDIEGLAVHGQRLFLGLRGPVLRGWAIVLEIEVEATAPDTLNLKAIGDDGERYKKHFVYLDGLGIRELCIRGDDLIIMAGPTMDLEGASKVYSLKNIHEQKSNSVSDTESGDLELLFELPFVLGGDKAEGLALLPCLGQLPGLLVVYDEPHARRRPSSDAVFADVFQLDAKT